MSDCMITAAISILVTLYIHFSENCTGLTAGSYQADHSHLRGQRDG